MRGHRSALAARQRPWQGAPPAGMRLSWHRRRPMCGVSRSLSADVRLVRNPR